METEISIYEIFGYLKRWAWAVITTACIGAIISVIGNNLVQVDQYRSEAQLIVHQKTNQEMIQYNEIQTNVSLINTYRQIILGNSVLERVSAQTEHQVSVGTLQNSIEIKQTGDAQTFNIIATLDSPQLAQEVVQSIINVFNQTLEDIFDSDILNVYVISAPSFEANRIKSNIILQALIGGVVGATITLGILLLSEVLDTTVKDENFLHQYGIVKLGELEALTAQEYSEALLPPLVSNQTTKRRN